jgi:hypothetical protein
VPVGKTTVAIISLFGGELGNAIIDLETDQRRKFTSPRFDVREIECVFRIDLDPNTGKKGFSTAKFAEALTKLWENYPLVAP